MGDTCSPQSQPRLRLSGFLALSGETRADAAIVAHVRPRTSKGITDLLSLDLVRLGKTANTSKKRSTRLVTNEDHDRTRPGRLKSNPSIPSFRPNFPCGNVDGALAGRSIRTPLSLRKRETLAALVNKLESRSLSESTRQIAPPTKNGHAPPPTESRKSS